MSKYHLRRKLLTDYRIAWHQIHKPSEFGDTCYRLNEIAKVSKLELETPKRIKEIWNDYHSSHEDTVSIILHSNEAESIHKK
mgnify:FL=1